MESTEVSQRDRLQMPGEAYRRVGTVRVPNQTPNFPSHCIEAGAPKGFQHIHGQYNGRP